MRRCLLNLLLVCAVGVAAFAAPAAKSADRIVVLKSQRVLILMKDGQELRRYKVALGTDPSGPKTRQGDHKTPEGAYIIDSRNSASQFHRALHVSYPNAADRDRAAKLGVRPGGAIMIHGLPNGYGAVGKAHLLRDWTDGCVAVTDEEIEEIWRFVPNGTPVEIKP